MEKHIRKELESKGREIVEGIEAKAQREIFDARNTALEAENALQQAEEKIRAANADIQYYKEQHKSALKAADKAMDRVGHAEARAKEAEAKAKGAEAKAKEAEKKIGLAEASAQEALTRAKKAERDAENAKLAKDQALRADEEARAAKRKADAEKEREMKRRVDEAEMRAQEALKQVEKANQVAEDACREKARLEARIHDVEGQVEVNLDDARAPDQRRQRALHRDERTSEQEDEALFLESNDERGLQDDGEVDMDVDARKLEVKKNNKGKERCIEVEEHSGVGLSLYAQSDYAHYYTARGCRYGLGYYASSSSIQSLPRRSEEDFR